jgi:F-type H+-transporting ATPase subunit delta
MAEKITIARPYAKAIFEIATNDKIYGQWSHLLSLLAMITQNPQTVLLLADKTIPAQHLIDLIFEICGKDLDEPAKNLVRLLADNRRLSVLPEIASLYEKLRSVAENRIEVELFTFLAITSQEEENFKKFLEQQLSKTVKLICKIDKNILGGFIARAETYVIDGSLRSRLKNLKSAMGG